MAGAQSLSNQERRHINTRILEVIEEYERVASIYDDESEYIYLSLFSKEDSPVICDIIGHPLYLTQVTAADYAKHLRSITSTANIMVSDVRKGEMSYSDNGWIVPITFRKNISYIDDFGYAFSIKDYYGTDLLVSMTLIYNSDSDTCKIESIGGTVDSDVTFPNGRFIIVNKPAGTGSSGNERFVDEFKADGKPLCYNEFGQAFVSSVEPVVSDVDIRVVVDTVSRGLNYDVVDFDITLKKTRIKPHYAIAPLSAYRVDVANGVSCASNAMEFGVDFGTTWPVGKFAKMGFFGGIGISMSKLDLSLSNSVKYSYNTSVLGEIGYFEKLNFTFDIESAEEHLAFTDLVVPLYLETEHKIGSYLLLSWNLGVKAYCNMKTDYGSYMVSGHMSENCELGGDREMNISISDNRFISPVTYKRAPFDISAMANIGVDVNVFKRMLYFSLRCGYEYGLNKSYKADRPDFADPSSGLYPVVYNPMTSPFLRCIHLSQVHLIVARLFGLILDLNLNCSDEKRITDNTISICLYCMLCWWLCIEYNDQ